MKKQSLVIEIYVFAKLGKQFCNNTTCLTLLEARMIIVNLPFMAISKVLETRASQKKTQRDLTHWGFLLYLCNEFTWRSKHYQMTISPDTHKFFLRYTIVETNVKTTLNTSYALVFSRDLQNSISFSIEMTETNNYNFFFFFRLPLLGVARAQQHSPFHSIFVSFPSSNPFHVFSQTSNTNNYNN